MLLLLPQLTTTLLQAYLQQFLSSGVSYSIKKKLHGILKEKNPTQLEETDKHQTQTG